MFYVISLDHYLNDKGAIALEQGPGRVIAEFACAVVAHASNWRQASDTPQPQCFKCTKRKMSSVAIDITINDLVSWRCQACRSEGEISNWRGTFWDLSEGAPPR